jgi:hypothetical protein
VDAISFQFNLRVPRDPQFVSTVRKLAVYAARYANCAEADAETFGGSVEKAVQACLQETATDATISVVVHRDAGPLEFRVDGHVVTVEP